jgi:hypothetical protein
MERRRRGSSQLARRRPPHPGSCGLVGSQPSTEPRSDRRTLRLQPRDGPLAPQCHWRAPTPYGIADAPEPLWPCSTLEPARSPWMVAASSVAVVASLISFTRDRVGGGQTERRVTTTSTISRHGRLPHMHWALIGLQRRLLPAAEPPDDLARAALRPARQHQLRRAGALVPDGVPAGAASAARILLISNPIPHAEPVHRPLWQLLSATEGLAVTDEAPPFALRSTRIRLRRAVRRGAASRSSQPRNVLTACVSATACFVGSWWLGCGVSMQR